MAFDGARQPLLRPSIEPAFVAFVATTSLAVALIHGFARVIQGILHVSADKPPSAAALTVAVVGLASLHFGSTVLVRRSRSAALTMVAATLTAAAFAFSGTPVGWCAAAALLLTTAVQILVATVVATRLAPHVGGLLNRRPRVSLVWTAVGVLLIVQSARLSTFMADPSVDFWLTTRHPLWAQHMCMPAYVEAADLQRRGVRNVYDARFYPVLTRDAQPALSVRNMDAWTGDPFQYPPPFLLLPRLALAVTSDFLALRTVWYVLQLFLVVGVALALCRWIGGASGWTAALLIPIVWLSIPGIQSLQYGQFHAAALALAIGGMLLFERRRHTAGGALLCVAIFAKLFPAVLLLWLMVQRRWRAVAWTIACGAVLTLAAFVTFGPDPFRAFVQYQVPRLSSGDAFDFSRAWPEYRFALVADNLSLAGVVEKLREIGVPGMTRSVGIGVLRVYTIALVGFVIIAGRKTPDSRGRRAALWLALLNLAALQAYGAWGDYVTLGSVWLLTLLAAPSARTLTARPARTAWILACWMFFVFVPGAQPMPGPLPATLALGLTTAIALMLIVFNATVALGAAPGRVAEGVMISPASRSAKPPASDEERRHST